ncbi:SRS domain-containing protein [Neospora caninum Liverpool]|uniref:SRS domain-containing protein n=1 Tax=Neospora caninum (strain Liverpool) TaxID=572307 RepID=F0VJ85_NEOCL|nr:SRS domain-containing protein [Neospora caninum Liverpool]CBZ53796.1 SRS domain-containing protein [Neospora caninum Liverpool]CEL67789.1 TPA: SRS domain-containing protein [Neospora caninum Liverpool]|eukprot:XP_003883828.1 SRS domain-containing protein [Neospora caninum Liverpool]
MRLREHGGTPPALLAATLFKIVFLSSLTLFSEVASRSDYTHVCSVGTEEVHAAANSTINFQCGPMLTLAPEASSNMVYRGTSCKEKAELSWLIPGAELFSADAQYMRKRSQNQTHSSVYTLRIGDSPAEEVQICYRCKASQINAIYGEAWGDDPVDRGHITTDTLCKMVIRVAAAPKTPAAAFVANLGRSLSVGLAFLTGLCF